MHRRLVIAHTLALGLVIAAAARADTPITVDKLPEAVRKALADHLAGGVVKAVATEVEAGQTYFEVETVRAGRARDLQFTRDGRLVSVEETIPLADAPKAVRDALARAGKVLKVETVTRGTAVTYEGVVVTRGRRSEIALDVNGSRITP